MVEIENLTTMGYNYVPENNQNPCVKTRILIIKTGN